MPLYQSEYIHDKNLSRIINIYRVEKLCAAENMLTLTEKHGSRTEKSMVKKIPVRYQFFIIVRVPKYIYLAGQMPCIGR